MKLRLTFVLLLCSLTAVTCAADAFDPATMLDVSQLHRGDAAVGKSVFAGIRITEFRLEILDVLRQANLGRDMILARVLDGPCVTRESGIIGGMSGSPVYVRGKLIGAIAWGWPFSKEPIAGITPIRTMLETFDLLEDKQGSAPAAGQPWIGSRPLTVAGRSYRAAQIVTPGQRVAPDVLPLRPVTTPINCSGFGPRTLQLMSEKLGPRGLQPVAGGGGTAEPVPVELVPGAAVGVRFMEGDFDMTGIGTVTYRRDDRILAFGHPLMQLGRVSMPLTTAWINEFIASYQRTDKLGSGMANVGALEADTPWAIGGRLGATAPLIPAQLEITDSNRKITRTFKIRVFDQPALTPIVLQMGISQALEAVYNPGAEGIVRTHFEVKGKHGTTAQRDNTLYMRNDPGRVALEEVGSFMQLLEDNRWDPQGIAELTFRAELSSRDDTAAIEKVTIEETVARAGKPVHVRVYVRPDGAPVQEHAFTLNMPMDLPKGVLRVGICGGTDALFFRSRFGIMLPTFENLPDLMDFAQKMEDSQQLCVVVGLPSSGVSVGTTRLMQVPLSIQGVLEKSTRTDTDEGREEMFASERLPYVLYGRQMLALVTEDRMGARGTVSATTTAPAASAKTDSTTTADADGVATGLWWAERALKPAVARQLRAEAAAAGRPWPAAGEATPKPAPAKPAADKTPTADKKETPEPAAKTDETEVKTIVRQPSVWLQKSEDDFAKGEATGLTILHDGGLAGAPKLANLGRLPAGYLWGALTSGDTTYLATGSPGRIYKLGADGKPIELCDPGVFALRGLAVDNKGALYAGAWPGGKIFKIADGKATVFADLPCGYVWALAFDKAGRLLAGTGPTGTLYAVDAAGKAEELRRVPQAHILSLLPSEDTIYLGTGSIGVVYKLLANGQLQALVSVDKADFTALAAGDGGAIYAGSSGGAVYQLHKSGATTYFEDNKYPIYALLWREGRLYAATGADGKLLALTGPNTYETVYDTDPTHLLCLAPTAGGFVIGSANAAEVMRVDGAAACEGTYTSSVFDAKRPANWGLIDWQATVPKGSQLQVQTRSGESPDPDDGSWGAWSAPYDHPGQQALASPPARYLQYRLVTQTGPQPPLLRWLSLTYLPANQQPTIAFDDDLTVGKPWKGEVQIEWTAKDPDSDKLLITLAYRKSGETAWETVKQLGPDDKSYKWKTSALKDGRYDVRLVVSDELANPGAALTGEQVLYAVTIDNTVPTLVLQRTEGKDGMLTVEALVSDDNRLSEVAYQLDDVWRGARTADGFCDGQYEQFTVTVPLKDGKAKVTLRARDAAGNVVTKVVEWPVPTETKPAPKPIPKETGH
jgi:hypothetical protein